MFSSTICHVVEHYSPSLMDFSKKKDIPELWTSWCWAATQWNTFEYCYQYSWFMPLRPMIVLLRLCSHYRSSMTITTQFSKTATFRMKPSESLPWRNSRIYYSYCILLNQLSSCEFHSSLNENSNSTTGYEEPLSDL